MPDLDVENVEAAQGGNGEDSSPSEEVVGLRKALQASRQTGSSLKVEMAEMKGKLDVLAAKTEKPREFTRAELQQQVDDGRMSPDDSDRILYDQMKRGITEEVTTGLKSEYQAEKLTSMIESEVSRYTEARPDIMVDGTQDRELVAAEYNRQVTELGKPKNQQTELDALMACFGPANRLQNGKDKKLQTHQETGSDGGSEGKKETSPKLPPQVEKHYKKMIDMGMYSGWDDEKLKSEIDPSGYGARWS